MQLSRKSLLLYYKVLHMRKPFAFNAFYPDRTRLKYLLVLLPVFLSCSHEKSAEGQQGKAAAMTVAKAQGHSGENIEEVWKDFAQAIVANDAKRIAQLSADCIRCSECVINTPAEDDAFNDFKDENPDSWYDKLNTELSYIPIDRFIKEDEKLIFDQAAKSRLMDPSKVKIMDDNVNKKLYEKSCVAEQSDLDEAKLKEVLVTVSGPSNKSEGIQKVFTFIDTEEGYKFCGYSTIP